MADRIVHWELMGPDGDRLKSFYEQMFGWVAEPVPGFEGYHMVDAAHAGVGGAVGTGSDEMPNYLTIYVEVDSVDERLDRAEAQGATTVIPRTVIPGMVTFGMFADPAGNIVGVVERETPPAE
jgi:predicted enzyme related to lactoylglutathione lyase